MEKIAVNNVEWQKKLRTTRIICFLTLCIMACIGVSFGQQTTYTTYQFAYPTNMELGYHTIRNIIPQHPSTYQQVLGVVIRSPKGTLFFPIEGKPEQDYWVSCLISYFRDKDNYPSITTHYCGVFYDPTSMDITKAIITSNLNDDGSFYLVKSIWFQ